MRRRLPALLMGFLLGVPSLHPDVSQAAPDPNCLERTPTAPGPTLFLHGDFNGDARKDLVTIANQSSLVQLFPGVGDGTFSPPVPVFSGPDVRDMTHGDFDEDGALDLAIVSHAPQGLRVLRGLGDGSFAPPMQYDAGIAPACVATGDFNVDGILDLAVLNDEDGRVAVLLGRGTSGTGDGTFAYRYSFVLSKPGVQEPRLLALDLDHDGACDLATSILAGNIRSIGLAYGRNSGAGEFFFGIGTTILLSSSPHRLALGDLDANGELDLVVADRDQPRLEFHAGLGARQFGPAILKSIRVAPHGVAVGDFDLDSVGRNFRS